MLQSFQGELSSVLLGGGKFEDTFDAAYRAYIAPASSSASR
jgi:hypothetical protein